MGSSETIPARALDCVVTITEYAERVLFSESLEEKLAILPLSELEDEFAAFGEVGSAGALVEPGRPKHLLMREKGETGRAPLPTRPQMVNEESRGVLFHFFGNHELMAAELMALALLKFPDAPRAFRKGLLQTLREEQRHTFWYVRRMQECGVEFGSHPLSRFFWDSVAPMETPLDYVTRLSLTFEQANLDYARHFAGIMDEVGDSASAGIMKQIYRDEISHVGYGLRWFRHWKREGQSDWDAYQGALHFPLSPSRAKGNGALFNRQGREEAGLDEEFVRELAVFERSKGRTPDVFWFNADAEMAMARDPEARDYEPKRSVAGFVEDLETLAIFLARRDDVVLCRRKPRREYLERLLECGFELPEFEAVHVEEQDGSARLPGECLTAGRRLRNLRPWSWEPRAERLFAPLREGVSVPDGVSRWDRRLRALFSKVDQAAQWPDWESGEETADLGGCSVVVPDANSIEGAVSKVRERWGGSCALVWKPAFSAAGRGFWLVDGGESQVDPRNFDGGPKKARRIGEGVLEPWVERVFDFSVQFERDRNGLRRLGFVRQRVGDGGAYLGTLWTPKFCRGLEPDLAKFLMQEALPQYEPDTSFWRKLENWLSSARYFGPVGVDSFVYRGREGEWRHRVVCEVNPRYTMGRIALDLSRRVSAGHSLMFTIQRKPSVLEPEPDLQKDSHGKLRSGRIVLTDGPAAKSWMACLEVAREPCDLESSDRV